MCLLKIGRVKEGAENFTIYINNSAQNIKKDIYVVQHW